MNVLFLSITLDLSAQLFSKPISEVDMVGKVI